MRKRNTLASLAGKEWLVLLLWFGLPVIAAAKEILCGRINNYLVFKHVFPHILAQRPLYIPYPAEYADVNLYGPLFGLIIAPFSYLPDTAGAILWVIANAAFLFFAIRQLPLTHEQQNIILLFSSHEMLGAASYLQFNPSIGACIILSFALLQNGKNFWAAFFIVLGTFTKLYGIVGIAFFFFSDNRRRFVFSLAGWSIMMFLLPMIFSTPGYILDTYAGWLEALSHKNAQNISFEEGVLLQDISAPGFIRRVFHLPEMNGLLIFIPAVLLFLSQYVMLAWQYNLRYRLYLLCTTLMFPVLFSTSAESSTYVIAFPAVCIWYVLQPYSPRVTVFFLCLFIFCSFSHSDLLTPWFRQNIAMPYAIKALPCLLLWLLLIREVLTKRFLIPGKPGLDQNFPLR